MSQFQATGSVLIYAINRTEDWWHYVGQNMGFAESHVVSDIRGKGDYCIVDDFYMHQQQFFRKKASCSDLLTEDQVTEIIARCRLLRFMPLRTATSMALGMATAFNDVLETSNPVVIVSFPIDRYVSDVLEKLAKARGIPYYELTVSAIPDMCMFLEKGVLCKHTDFLDPEEVKTTVEMLTAPLFTPSYVLGQSKFNLKRFLKIFYYFRLRAATFKIISWAKRDPLNLHYLDAQSFLGHKPHLSDRHVLTLLDFEWRTKLGKFKKSKRIFFGLQLFPEASIDYWILELELIAYENLVVDIAKAFSDDGYIILLKDHPLQFGFRKIELLKRLLAITDVVFVPYEVSGNEVLNLCDVNFTCTGTLGMQAALLGKKSIVTENYYTTDEDFIFITCYDDVATLPEKVAKMPLVDDIFARQKRIIENLLQGSFYADFFSYQTFLVDKPSAEAQKLGNNIGKQVRYLMEKRNK